MPDYRAPLDDMRFVLYDLLQLDTEAAAAGYEEVDRDLIDAVLQGGARVTQEVWAPLNQAGDAEGCIYENGVVRTPAGFRDAFAAWYEGGWNALSVPQQWGGQGLPGVLSQCLTEMAMSANLSLSTYVGLTGGVSGTLMRIAPEDLKQIYVPKLLSGAWTGTMNLTEPHCGTDLKLMRTTAVEQDDGTYLINGTKIFITGGEHDMADNIVHLVLAKVPGEGDGLSAVSLFLVPKFAVSADGSLGPRNGVTCGGIEDKMGLKGSATAVLHYEDAVGVRLGPKPKPRSEGDGGKPRRSSGGMAGMFQLMNGARIGVGMQGIAMAEVAYQNAVRYANERLSGRALQGAQAPDQPADPIIVHPDVRRMLMHVRSFVEAARALVLWLGCESTLAQRSGDAERRQRADDLLNLLTPVIKAHFTDAGFEAANLAMQCFGGHGYVKDHGMEQFVRDARISQLYEGANGVQALDLVARRLPAENGRAVQTLFATVTAEIEHAKGDAELAPLAERLGTSLSDLQAATLWLAQNAPQKRVEAGGASYDYLRLMGTVALGLMWLKLARAAADDGKRTSYLRMKRLLASYYMERVLPDTAALKSRIAAGADTLMAPDADMF